MWGKGGRGATERCGEGGGAEGQGKRGRWQDLPRTVEGAVVRVERHAVGRAPAARHRHRHAQQRRAEALRDLGHAEGAPLEHALDGAAAVLAGEAAGRPQHRLERLFACVCFLR